MYFPGAEEAAAAAGEEADGTMGVDVVAGTTRMLYAGAEAAEKC